MKSKIFIFFLFLPLTLFCQSNKPDVLASSGGTWENEEFSLSWTLGETFINGFLNGDLFLAQGFHQAEGFLEDSIEIPTSINQPLSDFEVSVYPNPATDVLKVYSQDIQPILRYKIEVFDVLGAKVLEEYARESLHEINFSSLTAGTYLVRISRNDYLKVFHIIKNDISHEKN